MENQTEIITRGSVAEKVKAYNEAMKRIEVAYEMLESAEKQLKDAFTVTSKHNTDFGTLPGRHHNSTDNVDGALKKVKETIKRKAWSTLYYLLEIDRIASIKRRDEIHQQLESGNLPEITVESIYEMMEALNTNINEFAKESVLEVYKWLRPNADSYEMTRYKTNQKNAAFELKKRIVKNQMVNISFRVFRTNHYNEKYLIALDKVFHMLDGKNMLECSYRSPLVDAINTSEGSSVSTDYFFCRMYQNGNLHIEFLRADLVQQFNAIAGGASLKPSN